MGASRRAAMLRIAHPGRDIAQSVRHQTHTESGWGLADRADAVLLIDQDLPDLLGVAVAAFGLEAGGLGIEIEYPQNVRIGRLGALFAAGRVPRRKRGPEPGTGNDRYCPGRK